MRTIRIFFLFLVILVFTGMAYKPKGAELKTKLNTKDQAVSAAGSVVIYGSIGLGYVGILTLGVCHWFLIRKMGLSCSRSSGKE